MKLTLLLGMLVFLMLQWCFIKPPPSEFEYHVIHLDHRTDRMNHIREMEKRIGHTINVFKASGPINREGFKPGEVGCYLSHMRLLNIPKNTKYSIILEDDFVIQSGFHERVQRLVQDAGDFDILYLGNLDENHGEHVKGDVYRVDPNKYLTGTHAYVVKNENAWKITSNLEYKHAIDLDLMDLIKTKRINGLVVWPSIASQKPELVSSIRV